MSFHQHCSLKHTIGQSQGEGVQLFYSFKITTTSIILYCPRPVSLCLDFFSVPPFYFFFCDASFSFSTKIQIFYLSTYSSLHFVPYLSLLFLLSFSYHDIDHLKSIHIVFFCPPSFVFSSVFLLHAHLDVKGIWLVILQLFKNTHTFADTEWRQCSVKIYADVISADRAIDRQQYSHDRNDSPSSLSQSQSVGCVYECAQTMTKVV